MSRRDSIVLKVAAGWTLFVWGTFVRNLLKNDSQSMGFKVVHITLAVVSVGFAVAMWMIASRNRKQAGDRIDAP